MAFSLWVWLYTGSIKILPFSEYIPGNFGPHYYDIPARTNLTDVWYSMSVKYNVAGALVLLLLLNSVIANKICLISTKVYTYVFVQHTIFVCTTGLYREQSPCM